MAPKSIEDFQTSQKMDEKVGPTPETVGDDSLSQPIQGFDMSVKEYYDQFCSWISKLEAVNSDHYVDDDEWYVVDFIFGLEMDIMERVLRYKGIRRVSEAFHWAVIEENSGKNDTDVVFDGMCNPESKHCDALQEAEDVGNEKIGHLVEQLEADHGKIVSLNTGRDVLDVLLKPALTASTAYELTNDDLDVCSELTSQEASYTQDFVYTQDFGNSENEALKLLNNSTGLQLTEKVVCPFFARQRDLRIACEVFDETPRFFFVEPKEEFGRVVDPIPPVDGISQVFDPGTSIINGDLGAAVMLYMPWPSICIYNELIPPSIIETASSKSSTGKFCSISTVEKVGMFSLNAGVQLMDTSRELFLSKEGRKSCEYSAVSLPNDWGYEASVITSLEMDVYFCVDAMLMIIFDPGGNPLYVKRGSFFMPNSHMQNLDLKLDEFNSARVDMSCSKLYSHHKNDLVYSASRECQNVKLFTNPEALFLADPEISYYLSRLWILNGVICEEKSPYPKSKNGLHSIVSHQHRKVDKGVVFSFDPGGNFSHNRAGPYEAFKLSFAKPLCFLCINIECFHKSRKHELQVNDVLGILISTAQAFPYNHSRDDDVMHLEPVDKAVRVDEQLNGAFTGYEAYSGLRFDFKEAPGVNNMILDNRLHTGSIYYLHHHGYIHPALFMFGCFALTISSRKMQIMIQFLVQVWCALCFIYILGDKDVVERVGKDMVLMDTTLVIRVYDHEVQMSCLHTMEYFGSDLKHFKQYYGYDDVFQAICSYTSLRTCLGKKRFELRILWDTDSDILDVSCGLPNGFRDSAVVSLVSSTLELEHFIWDPGSFISSAAIRTRPAPGVFNFSSFGRRTMPVEEILNIDIKPGWKKVTKVTFPEKGNEQPNVVPANLVFVIDEKPHSVFTREREMILYTHRRFHFQNH